MKKFYLLLGLVFLLCMASVSAADLSSPVGYWSFDTNYQDDSSNGNDATNTGTTIVSADCKLNDCADSSSAGTSQNIDLNVLPSSGDYSISTWCKWDSFSSNPQDQCLSSWSGVDGGFYVGYDGSGIEIKVYQDTTWVIDYSDTGINTGTWYFLTLTFDATNKVIKYYRDGSLLATSSSFSSLAYPVVDIHLMNQPSSTTRSMNGRVDETSYYTEVLTLTEHQTLWNNGDGFNPLYTNITVNDSTESTAVVKQSGSVTFGGGAMTTIISSDFNLSVNDTPLYGVYNFNIESNGNNDVYCELLIDSIVYANDTRSNIAGFKGVFNLQTPYLNLDNSTSHSQSLQCQRVSGVGLTTITNAVGIGHFAVDQENNILAHNDTIFVTSVSSGLNYTLLDSFTITIGNKTSDENNHSLVIEGSLHYENTLGVTQELNTYMQVNETRCAFYPRDVQSGNIGSVSVDCAIENVTAEATYVIEIYGNGTATYDGTITAKDLFLSDEEIAGGTGILNGTVFSGATDTKLFNLTGGNLNHDIANVFQKVSYSIETDVNTEINFYVIIKNGSTFQTINFSRDFQAGVIGVLSGHDVLENIPIDPNYDIELWANCGTVGANCTIKGGSSLGYLTDVTTTVLNAFNVSAYDYFSNSNIQNFTVVDGGTWISTTGSILVFTENDFENLTITSNGYQSLNVLNHNTTLDLNVTLTPLYYFENVYYEGYTNYSSNLYSNNITYYIEALCPLGETHNAYVVVNDVVFLTDQLVCNNNLVNNTGSFVYSFEGEYDQYVNWTGNNNIRGNLTINWDLFRPTIVQSFTTGQGFNNDSIDINVLCYDSVSPLLTYNSTFVNTLLTYSNQTNNTLLSFSDTVQQNNYVYTECTDLAGNQRTNNFTQTVYNSFFYLVNEQDGTLFDVNNLTSVVVYLDDNTTSLNLKSLGTNNFSFTSAGSDILRFEYIYLDGSIINRYYSMDLTDSNETRICAIPDSGLQFYEQVIVSSIDSKQVSLEASFADCVVIRDRTRFAYQNAFSIRTYVIDTTYKLYNYVAGNVKSILASIDGGIEAFINVDSIEFSSSAFNQGIRAESLTIEKFSTTTMVILYNNTNQDNSDLDLIITRQDTGAIVYSDSELDNNNEFVLFYDFSSLVDLQNDTLFRVVVDATRVDGSTNTIIRFFNTNGSVGQLDPKVAFAIIFTFLLFGLTFPAASDALSWFGLLLCIGNLGLFALTVMTTGLTVLLAINVIVLIYIGIILSTQTNRVVAT